MLIALSIIGILTSIATLCVIGHTVGYICKSKN